jgi:hypothetical protein
VNRRVPREWLEYQYFDPEQILVGLRDVALTYPLHELQYHARTLRTRKLRKHGEGRQAALFCYGMSCVINSKVSFALVERENFDIIAKFEKDGEENFVPVQLKEWTPEFLPSPQPLQVELDKLKKYSNAADLAVAFHLNRETRVVLSELTYPRNIGELWFYGCMEPSQNHWVIIGDLLKESVAYGFTYPEA